MARAPLLRRDRRAAEISVQLAKRAVQSLNCDIQKPPYGSRWVFGRYARLRINVGKQRSAPLVFAPVFLKLLHSPQHTELFRTFNIQQNRVAFSAAC
jgi:hypothetical protein